MSGFTYPNRPGGQVDQELLEDAGEGGRLVRGERRPRRTLALRVLESLLTVEDEDLDRQR